MARKRSALEFFNGLSGILRIQVSEPPVRAAPHLLNLVTTPTTTVLGTVLELSVYEGNGDARPLTEDEWNLVVIPEPRIRMCSLDAMDGVVEHEASTPAGFTVRDLCAAIGRTEKEARGRSKWLGGVDVHHIFFEGISLENGVWAVAWGS